MRHPAPCSWRLWAVSLGAALGVSLLAACTEPERPVIAQEPTPGTTCVLDGMLLADFPGPKGQVDYYKDPPDFFCDTFELLATYLSPEEQKRIRAVFTQDMAKADWKKPAGNLIDARSASYVFGSDMKGSLGPTAASFARREDAEAFARQHGGKVVRFQEITPAMVSLDGGVIRDEKM